MFREIDMTRLLYSALACATLAAAPVAAQDYPTGPVTMVVPFTPGGSNDLIARYLAQGLSESWGESVVVENRPGAGSAIGSAHVSKAAPDGETLLFVSGTYTTNAATQTTLPFDPLTDLRAVGMAALGDRVIVTGSRIAMPTLADVATEAKAGKLFYGTTGIGSSTQFDTEFLNSVLGVKMEPVHYPGGSDAMIDLLGGRIDVYVGSVTQVLPTLEGGKANAVAVMSHNRSGILPDVPTVSEAGFPGAETYIWWGVFVPGETPDDIVETLNADIRATMTAPEAAEFLATNGLLPPQDLSSAEFAEHVATELARWKELAVANGMVAN